MQSGINVDRLIEKKKKALKKLEKQQKKAEKEKAKWKKVLPCHRDPSGATLHHLPAWPWPSCPCIQLARWPVGLPLQSGAAGCEGALGQSWATASHPRLAGKGC